jgi:hypothetical protein
MTPPHVAKVEQARGWLADPALPIDAAERALLEELVRRYPEDPTLTPPERRRLLREYALIAGRLGSGME